MAEGAVLGSVVTGFSPAEATSISGASYRQLDYWARIGILLPSIRNAAGSGSNRCYSLDDVVVLAAVVQVTRGDVDAVGAPAAPWLLRAIQFARRLDPQPLTSDLCVVVKAGSASLMSKTDAVSAVIESENVVTVLPFAPAIEYVRAQTYRARNSESVRG